MDHDKVTPYNSNDGKSRQVEQMFDNIAGRYDLLNSLLSLRIHKGWRKKCVALLRESHPSDILDVATGTADFAIECAKLQPRSITGIDISEGMLEVGRKKIRDKHLEELITLKKENAEVTTLPDGSFDAIVVGFGVRNFQELEKGLTNMRRMLRPDGQVVILEFSYPTNPLVKGLYNFYFSFVTPTIGKIFSNDNRAYKYLTESVKAFPNNERFVEVLKRAGFRDCSYKKVSFGIAAIYRGFK
jgi:demethylmenaquinone methyltransferase / 2-methoxy-6-polyprenyl-1,4-benzoquinol methylase